MHWCNCYQTAPEIPVLVDVSTCIPLFCLCSVERILDLRFPFLLVLPHMTQIIWFIGATTKIIQRKLNSEKRGSAELNSTQFCNFRPVEQQVWYQMFDGKWGFAELADEFSDTASMLPSV